MAVEWPLNSYSVYQDRRYNPSRGVRSVDRPRPTFQRRARSRSGLNGLTRDPWHVEDRYTNRPRIRGAGDDRKNLALRMLLSPPFRKPNFSERSLGSERIPRIKMEGQGFCPDDRLGLSLPSRHGFNFHGGSQSHWHGIPNAGRERGRTNNRHLGPSIPLSVNRLPRYKLSLEICSRG